MKLVGYKALDENLCYKGFQYEVGKTYKELENPGVSGTIWLNPKDAYLQSKQGKTRYVKVGLCGNILGVLYSTSYIGTEITIIEEISDIHKEMMNCDWWQNEGVLDYLFYNDEGLAKIQRFDNKWNFIKRSGEILSETWFFYMHDFVEDFALVENDFELCNFIDRNGKLLSEDWFEDAADFSEGLANVIRFGEKEWIYIDKQGNHVFDKTFDYCYPFNDGFAAIQRNEDELWNFINKEGNLLSKEWFANVNRFSDGVVIVRNQDGLFNAIDKTGKLCFTDWLDYSYIIPFHEGFSQVCITTENFEYKYNFIDKTGKLLSDEWFKDVSDFDGDYTQVVRTNGERCKIDKTGKISPISDKNFCN